MRAGDILRENIVKKVFSRYVFEVRHVENIHIFDPKTILRACYTAFNSHAEGHKMIAKMRLYRDVGFALTFGFVYSQIFYGLFKKAVKNEFSIETLLLSLLYLFVGGAVCKFVRGLVLRANYEFNIDVYGREEDIPAKTVVVAILMSLKMYPAILIVVLPVLIWIAPGISISISMLLAVLGAIVVLVFRYFFESKGHAIDTPDMDGP